MAVKTNKIMDITLKVLKSTFDKIKNGQIDYIQHGFSKNKKYMRLFKPIEVVTLVNSETGEMIQKIFKSISIIDLENNKKVFKIQLS